MRYLAVIILLISVWVAPLSVADTEVEAQTAQVIALEIRARDVGRTLRCVVCQNQSIEDSDAPLAADMRALVRQQIEAGQTDAQIRAFMQERYGDFVLLKPPLKPSTYALWALPFLLVAGLLIARFRNGPAPKPSAPLSDQERGALRALNKQTEPRA